MAADQLESYLLIGTILAAILAVCSAVIIRRWILRRPIRAGSQYMAQNIYLQYQNAERRRSIEQVMYQREDERGGAFGGEGFDDDYSNKEG